MKLKAKHFAWIYLLKEGNVNNGWSYYGGSYDNDDKATDKAYHDILNHGVDWSKTKEPRDDQEDSFAGTFCEYNESTHVLEGTLHTNNNKEYRFGCCFDNSDIFKVMEEIGFVESVETFVAKEILKEL